MAQKKVYAHASEQEEDILRLRKDASSERCLDKLIVATQPSRRTCPTHRQGASRPWELRRGAREHGAAWMRSELKPKLRSKSLSK